MKITLVYIIMGRRDDFLYELPFVPHRSRAGSTRVGFYGFGVMAIVPAA